MFHTLYFLNMLSDPAMEARTKHKYYFDLIIGMICPLENWLSMTCLDNGFANDSEGATQEFLIFVFSPIVTILVVSVIMTIIAKCNRLVAKKPWLVPPTFSPKLYNQIWMISNIFLFLMQP